MTLIELLEDIVVLDDNGQPVKVLISKDESVIPRINLFTDNIGVSCWVTYFHQEDKNQILEQIIMNISDVPDYRLISIAHDNSNIFALERENSKLLFEFSKITLRPEAV